MLIQNHPKPDAEHGESSGRSRQAVEDPSTELTKACDGMCVAVLGRDLLGSVVKHQQISEKNLVRFEVCIYTIIYIYIYIRICIHRH